MKYTYLRHISVAFDKYIHPWYHHDNQGIEHFIHFKKVLMSHPSQSLLLPLVPGNHQSAHLIVYLNLSFLEVYLNVA